MAARPPAHHQSGNKRPGHFGGPPAEGARGDEGPDGDADAVKTLLGRNINSLRTQRGMAVRDLAEQAGVSAAFISQVEHGTASPSVPTLVRIAQALRAHIGDLFQATLSSSQIVRHDERAAYEYPDRGITEAQVSSDASGCLEVLWVKLEPGGGTGPELFAHGADTEFVFVLKGQVAITVGSETHRLSAGDSLTFPGKDVHGSQNLSRGSSELLWVQTPASY
ncbi:helix-turn-helix domain-containing protein [Actinomadura luteofluorescens]|uniref:helix-turn-helix domain-containing protein n=1 Tax=Actinomadura luteofluorescens TaxID=46163 RepID=UPI003476CE51